MADQHPLGGSPIVRAAMRRNRWRLLLLTVVSLGNAFAVYALFGAIAGGIAVGVTAETWHRPAVTIGVLAFASGLVGVGLTAMQVFIWLPQRISGGLGVAHVDGRSRRVTDLMDELSLATGLDAPDEVGVIPTSAPNAIALGRRPGATAIVVTQGAVDVLTRDELEAVLASEMIASARLDTALRTLVVAFAHRARATFASWIPLEARWNPLLILWTIPFGPMLLTTTLLWRTALIENGEQADALAIAVTRNPASLLEALRKLRADQRVIENVPAASTPLWVEPEGVTTWGRPLFSASATSHLLDRRIEHLARLCGERS